MSWEPSLMMNKQIVADYRVLAVSFFFTLLHFFAMPAIALDGNAILNEVDKNLQPESYEMYRKLINIEPDGDKKEFVLYSVKKGRDKMVALFLSPASEKGRSTLRLGENMWLYIPSVGKPIRITSLQSMVGGVFNNSDILRLDYSTEYNVTSIQENENHYLLELKAKTAFIAYDRLKMLVDKERMVPTTIECYTASNMLIKTLYYKQPKDFGNGIIRPAVLETDSPLHKGYKSIMIYAKINKKELADEIFSLNYLPKVAELR
jgi:outer membrane lipoprotein-sorting protein